MKYLYLKNIQRNNWIRSMCWHTQDPSTFSALSTKNSKRIKSCPNPQVLLKRYRFHSSDSGLTKGSKNTKAFVDPPFHIDHYYTAFLQGHPELMKQLGIKLIFVNKQMVTQLKKITNKDEYLIFNHFVRDYYLLDAHKFGGLFLAYEKDYDQYHAQLLIFHGPFQLNHMTRLAALCKKQGIHAEVAPQGIQLTTVERTDEKRRQRSRKHSALAQSKQALDKVQQDADYEHGQEKIEFSSGKKRLKQEQT